MGSEKGQSLIEVIVASVVGIMVVAALTFATIFSLRNAQFAKTSAQATKLAQEGIERVRTGRDRNAAIGSLPSSTDCPNVTSWNGDATGNGAVWNCKIYNTCGSGGNCYLRFTPNLLPNDPNYYVLNYLTTTSDMPSTTEDPLSDGKFKRAIILSDDATSYPTQKTVTVIVRWNDATGNHDSRLTTILRKL